MAHEREKGDDEVVFVGGGTNSKGLATCIFASATREDKDSLKLRGIGAGANNQMTKGIIIAKEKLYGKGIKVEIDFYFKDIPAREEGAQAISGIEYLLIFHK